MRPRHAVPFIFGLILTSALYPVSFAVAQTNQTVAPTPLTPSSDVAPAAAPASQVAGSAQPQIQAPSQTQPPPLSDTETRALATSTATQEVQAQQALSKSSPIPDGSLEVTATGTLEWLRQDDMYVARENAVARHNDTTLKGNVLVAHYQVPPGKKTGTEITEVTAEGNPVELISPSSVIYGQHGVYDMIKHIALLLGDNLKLVTTDEIVTARDSMEYFEDVDTGVARGDAVMLRGPDKLTADVIAAKFVHQQHPDEKNQKESDKAATVTPPPPPVTQSASGNGDKPQKGSALERLDAKGHVVLVTETDIVTGDEAVYNPITDQATVLGKVHVTRDQNQLDGNRAEVDMETGISRVYAAPSTKVRALFVPKKKDKKDAADQTAASGEDQQ